MESKFTIFATNKKTNIVVYGALILILLSACAAIIYSDYTGAGGVGEKCVLEVTQGMTLDEFARLLKQKGVIAYPAAFKLYCKNIGGVRLDVAKYAFAANMSYQQVVEGLSTPIKPERLVLTIPEGLEIYEVAKRVEKLGIATSKEFLETCNDKAFDFDFIKALPKRKDPPEGYLFPETYFFEAEATSEDVINTCFNQFDKILTEKRVQRMKQLGWTVDKTIIFASVIEREAANVKEMPMVSSVFHNRLAAKPPMKLESCATVQYILNERKPVLSFEDIKIDSPYNTYLYPGLPIGPICSPGEAAIDAALFPAESNYLYFHSLGEEGVTTFSETLNDHNSSIKSR